MTDEQAKKIASAINSAGSSIWMGFVILALFTMLGHLIGAGQ